MQTFFCRLRACLSVCLCLGVTGLARGENVGAQPTPDFLSDTSGAASYTICSHDDASTCTNDELCCSPCSACCCTLCPCNYFWAEGLILSRDNQSRSRPLVFDLNTEDVALRTSDLAMDWAGGYRIGYCTLIGDCLAAELVYFGVFDNSDTDRVALEDSLILPDDLGIQVNNFGFADNVGVRYSSDLHSVEANLVECCCCRDCCGGGRSVEIITGFRYLNLNEDFGLTAFDSAESTSTYRVETENNLYGAQIGSRYRHCYGSWSWEATGKAGIYANHMEQSQAPIIDFPAFTYRSGRGSDHTDVAFVGDLNLTAIYQLNCVWGLRAGYNLIWLDGVALAPDQLDFTNSSARSGRQLVDDGGVFLHGVNMGLEARW